MDEDEVYQKEKKEKKNKYTFLWYLKIHQVLTLEWDESLNKHYKIYSN